MIELPVRIGRATVSRATDAEICTIAGDINEAPRSGMFGWHLVRVTDGIEDGIGIHALGWMRGDVYITSPVQAFDVSRGLIKTRSGKVYSLGAHGDPVGLEIPLWHHLLYALFAWRCLTGDDIAAAKGKLQ